MPRPDDRLLATEICYECTRAAPAYARLVDAGRDAGLGQDEIDAALRAIIDVAIAAELPTGSGATPWSDAFEQQRKRLARDEGRAVEDTEVLVTMAMEGLQRGGD